ncbi:hypothetical protein [Novosphingobium sp.]|uniref:hypothetical protein n=1 Tax=Novosphingobium sp. TaxID=1874826 RepID=UPI0038B78AC3
MSSRGLLDADMQTLGGWIADAVRWWTDKLRAMVPQGLRARLSPSLAEIRFDPDQQTFADEPRGAWVAVLPEGVALLRRVPLPPVRGRELQRLIELDADRLMPFGGGAMIVAGQAQPGSAAPDSAEAQAADLAVAGLPTGLATAIAAAIKAAPREPARLLVKVERGLPIDLLPALRRAGLLPDRSGAALRWWAAVAFLFALNIALLVWRDVAARDAMAEAVAAQQPGMMAVRQITGRMHRADQLAAAALASRERAEPLALMARLQSALPPGAWLQRMAWSDGSLRLTGFRPPNADVSGALRHAGFVTVRYGDGASSSSATTATPLGQPFEIIVRTDPARPVAKTERQ